MNPIEWLTLANAHITVTELGELEQRFGDIATIVASSATSLSKTGLAEKKSRAIVSPDTKSLQLAEKWLEDEAHNIVPFGTESFPELLAQLRDAPLLLYVNGDIDALHFPSIAIVGSRNPTRGGLQNSFEFSRHLAKNGFAIISGLAEGIDTAAHKGALKAGGKTVALLGHGIDRIYPPQNRELAHEIVESGALVTEYPMQTPPEKRHFPERNRLISGLSVGTLVVEAARRSGSLITARTAAEQGREVFAVPGSIHNPMARGCHQLIRQGAKLVETASDIGEELAPLVDHLRQTSEESTPSNSNSPEYDAEYTALRRALGHDPISVEQLQGLCGLTIEQLSSMLLILELNGEVESLPGGRFALIA